MSPARPRQAWLPEVLARLTAASGIGYVAAAYTASRWLTRPTPGKPAATPSDHGLDWEPLTCVTEDRLRLVGWAITPPRPRATVALFHGLRHNRGQTLSRAVMLAEHGYRCVALDHRAHGESDGRRTSFGYYESRDVAAVLTLIRSRWPKEPCAGLGMSMGAAALCFAGRAAGGFDAIILESVYQDIASAFASRLQTTFPPWFRRFGPGIVRVSEWRMGVRMAQIAPAEHIPRLAPAPVLLLTGTDDDHAPPEETRRLYDRFPGPRELWLVPGAGHKNVYETAGDEYREKVLGFLDRRLKVA